MRTTKLLLLSAMAILTLSTTIELKAQNNTLATRKLEAQGDKFLNMEEAILPYNVSPKRKAYTWRPGTNDYSFVENNVLMGQSVKSTIGKEILSLDEVNIILGTELKNFPRYSFKNENTIILMANSHYYEIDIEDKVLNLALPLAGRSHNFTPAPEGYFAFTRENNLFIVSRLGEETQITKSEDKNIVNGQIVSRNEFGISGGIFWSDDSKKLAFYRKDESEVESFPLLDITATPAKDNDIKYPMVGRGSEKVSLGVYDLESEKLIFVDLEDYTQDKYLTNITWTPDSEHILILELTRDQKYMKLNMYCATTGVYLRTILEERDSRYVEPLHKPVFLKGNPDRFIYTINTRDDYRNLYIVDMKENTVDRLVDVDADIQYLAQDKAYVYFSSAENSPVENHIYKVSIKTGKKTALTTLSAWHSASFSSNCRYFIDTYSNVNTPNIVELRSSTVPKFARILFEAEDPVKDYNFGEVELGSIPSADGLYLNYYRMIKPANFDPLKKYPVIVYVYGGPHSQMVQNKWLAQTRLWEMYMAQRGYIVYVQDNRGTSNQGAEFEKAIYGKCGQAEMEDQMKGVEYLSSLPYVDTDRIGVHGWSYGGFMTISLMTNYPEVFKVGVAGGPVIDWKWYEVMYGERYMGQLLENQEGYELTSLLKNAAKLEGKLLICQGVIDPVVVWQHSLAFVRECIIAGVQVDYFPYPRAEHNVLGKDRVHLMTKVTMYFEDYL